MSSEPNSRELDDLISGLLTGTLAAEQHARLHELLLDNPAAQDRYFSHIDLHVALQRLTAIQGQPDPVRDTAFASAEGSWRRIRILLAAWATVAASVAIVAGWILWQPTGDVEPLAVTPPPEVSPQEPAQPLLVEPPTPGPVVGTAESPAGDAVVANSGAASPAALLRQAAGAELLREFVPEVGGPLQTEHEYVLIRGLMELEFGRGAVAIMKAPAVFTIQSADRMELKIGNCSVYAPEGAQGFEVLTPQSRVVDLGTRFSVNVNDVGGADVQVLEGAAEIRRDSQRQPVTLLTQGQASRIAGNSERLQTIPFNPGQYQRGLPDRVISYDAEQHSEGPGVRDLRSVTVQRGGVARQYAVEELIGIDVVHFAAFTNKNNAATDVPLPTDVAELLTGDVALNTGLINFDCDSLRRTPNEVIEDAGSRFGLAVKFRQPVVNGPGPDVVVFEVQSVVYPAEGDHFRVSPLMMGPGLRQHLVDRFDITLNSVNAREVAPFNVVTFDRPARSVQELGAMPSKRGGNMPLPFYALAVGIDLSDLGYPQGAEVDGLFFEDANDNTTVVVDPVFIGGFPAVLAEGQ